MTELVEDLKQLTTSADGLMLMISLVVALASMGAEFFRHRAEEKQYEKESQEFDESLKRMVVVVDSHGSTVSGAKTTVVDASERMALNLKGIERYYDWSRDQAVSAHRLALILSFAGFILLLLAVVLAVNSPASTGAAIVAGIGGATTELLAGTALVIYRHSLTQLNYYHEALHEDERFLATINFLNKFSTDEMRDAMLQEILRSEIGLNVHDRQKRMDALNEETSK